MLPKNVGGNLLPSLIFPADSMQSKTTMGDIRQQHCTNQENLAVETRLSVSNPNKIIQ